MKDFRNQVASQVKTYHCKRNVINLNTHNSWKHELIKCRICYLLKQQNMQFFTEVPLRRNKHNAIADILVLDTAEVIEIMVSETLKALRKKTEKYPNCLEILGVKSADEYFEGKYKLIRAKEI